MVLLDLLEQRFDELVQVVDLLELAAAVLVELAVARQDVQLLQQLDRLAGADFRRQGRAPGWWCQRASSIHACLNRFEYLLAAARAVVVEAVEFDDPVLQVDEATVAGSTSGYFSYSASAMAGMSLHS